MRRLAAPAVLLGAALAMPTAASAVWGATAGGAGSAGGTTLAPPASTTLSWDPTVHLTWTASPSTWASGYRVLRGVAPETLTQLGADRPAPTTVDDTPGAGTHYYAVVTYRNGWTSQPGEVRARSDRNYLLTGAAPTGGTGGCTTAASTTGMRQGHALSDPAVSFPLGTTTYSLCTDTWTTGQSLPAGSTTMTVYAANTHGKTACSVGLAVRVNGASLGTASVSVQPGQADTAPLVWTVPTTAVSFTTGQRVTLTLTPGGGAGCSNTTLRLGTSTYPSKVTLTA